MPTVPLRWVLVRDRQAFLSTDETAEPEQILAWFIRRWQIEVTFEEARAHLGMETQRNGPIVPLPAPRPSSSRCIRS